MFGGGGALLGCWFLWGGAGGGIFFLLLVDFFRPSCVKSVNVLSTFMNNFCPNWGWGLVFFLVDLISDFSDFSWGVVFFLWVVVFCIFLGEGFSSSWQIFLLGVLNFG